MIGKTLNKSLFIHIFYYTAILHNVNTKLFKSRTEYYCFESGESLNYVILIKIKHFKYIF